MFASPVVFAAADIDLEVCSLAPGQLLRNLYRCPALRMLIAVFMSTPTRAFATLAARGAAIGQVAAEPAIAVMNSRRRIALPEAQEYANNG
jgi:hypothetical protein